MIDVREGIRVQLSLHAVGGLQIFAGVNVVKGQAALGGDVADCRGRRQGGGDGRGAQPPFQKPSAAQHQKKKKKKKKNIYCCVLVFFFSFLFSLFIFCVGVVALCLLVPCPARVRAD